MARVREFDQMQVTEKALELFWEKGYYNTSIQELVDAIGIGRGSLYNTYGSKHDLFLLTLDTYTDKRNRQVLDQLRRLPVKEAFGDFMAGAVEDMINDPNSKGCFIVNTMTEMASIDQEVHKRLSRSEDLLISCFEDALQYGVDHGEISADKNLRELAVFLSTTLKGLRVRSKVVKEREALMSAVNIAMTVL